MLRVDFIVDLLVGLRFAMISCQTHQFSAALATAVRHGLTKRTVNQKILTIFRAKSGAKIHFHAIVGIGGSYIQLLDPRRQNDVI
jgi:hypothetical protein